MAPENFVQPVWANYRRLLREQVQLPPEQWTFKGNPIYRQFLEAVPPERANQYLTQLRARPWWNADVERVVASVAYENDRFGAPVQHRTLLAGGMTCSLSNIQYAWQAMVLLDHLRARSQPEPLHIFELGAGYGGLALYVWRLGQLLHLPLGAYYTVDLPEVAALQQQYFKALYLPARSVDGTDAPVLSNAVDSCDSGTRVFVGCYSFGELTLNAQVWYQAHLARFCPRGFVIWNWTPPYPLYDPEKAPQTIVDETIFTEPGTKVVTW